MSEKDDHVVHTDNHEDHDGHDGHGGAALPVEDMAKAQPSRRAFLGAALGVLGGAAVMAYDAKNKSREEALNTLTGLDIDPNEAEKKLENLLGSLKDFPPELEAKFREVLDELKKTNPEAYSKLTEKLKEGESHGGATWVDYAGGGVFFHGLKQIMDPKVGCVSSGPYLELAGVWVTKFLLSAESGRHHLLEELKMNAMLIPAIILLVTLGENTTFDVRGFQEEVNGKLNNSEAVKDQKKDILARGQEATKTIDSFYEALKTEFAGGQNKSVKVVFDNVSKRPEFNQNKDQKRLIQYFIKKELGVAEKVAYLNAKKSQPNLNEDEFYASWIVDGGGAIVKQLTDRFSSAEKIDKVFSFGAGTTVFPSATSPVATTVATAAIAKKSGINKELVGDPSIGFPEGYEHYKVFSKLTPPFETRILALLEDHVANLSGLGGVGDPPFLAMLMKFGLKGFAAQTITSFPATALSAELGYKDILLEYFPYLSEAEAHKIAASHMVKLFPTYIKLLGANIGNTVGALVEAATMSIGGGALAGAVVGGNIEGVGALKGAGAGAGLAYLLGKLGLKDQLEKKFGPSANWRFRSGVQFSLPDMAFEVGDELTFTEKPSQDTLKSYFDELTVKIKAHFEKLIVKQEEGEEGAEVSNEEQEGSVRYKLSEQHSKHAEQVEMRFAMINNGLRTLWRMSTYPGEVNEYGKDIEQAKVAREEAITPEERHQATAQVHRLTRAKRLAIKSRGGQAERKGLIEKFAAKRDEVKGLLDSLQSDAELIDDAGLRREILYFIGEARKKIVKLELSQLGLFNTAGETGAMDFLDRGLEKFDMEHLKALLGHSRAEVLNVLTFQAHCVPFLTEVFKDALNVLPQNLRPMYVFLLYWMLNIFSSGADNLVASLVGLGIDPTLWPYIQQASVDGGKNSRIGNMANLAGCSLEDFPLNVSLCLYLLSKRMKKAGINLGYAFLVDQVSKAIGFELKPLNEAEAEEHAKKMKTPEENEEELADASGLINMMREKFKGIFSTSGAKGKRKGSSRKPIFEGETFEAQFAAFQEQQGRAAA